jgi:hypothetical protein
MLDCNIICHLSHGLPLSIGLSHTYRQPRLMLPTLPAPFLACSVRSRKTITERVHHALCTSNDGYTVPRHAKAGMGKTDESTGTPWRGWKNIREHGVVQVRLRPPSYFPWVTGY